MSWDRRLIALKSPAQQFLWDYARFIAHSNSHTAGFDGTFARRVFHLKMLECLQVMTQSRFSGGQSNSTGRTLYMLIAWRLSGISNHQGPIGILFIQLLYHVASVVESMATTLVHVLHHKESSQTEWCEKSLDYLIKGYNTSGRFKTQLDDKYCQQLGVEVGQRFSLEHFWDYEVPVNRLKDWFIHVTKKRKHSYVVSILCA